MIPSIARLYELFLHTAAVEVQEFLADQDVELNDELAHELVATVAPALHTAGLLHAFMSYTEGGPEDDADPS